MPSIPKFWLNAVVYLYPTEGQAHESAEYGATGFIVTEDMAHPELADLPIQHSYVVTNAHAIGCQAVRINSPQGGVHVFPVDPDRWFRHPDGDDVAVIPMGFSSALNITAIPSTLFLTRELEAKWQITAGDECFYMGRFIGLEGKLQNKPTVRFGTVSSMDPEPVLQRDRGVRQESILVESRSLPGFSGSPVFVMPGPYVKVDETEQVPYAMTMSKTPIFFLGIDWGHQPFIAPVLINDDQETGAYVKTNAGMMMVVPAWKIRETLDRDEFGRVAQEDGGRCAHRQEAPRDDRGRDGHGAEGVRRGPRIACPLLV